MKRLATLALSVAAAVLALALTACGSQASSSASSASAASTSAASSAASSGASSLSAASTSAASSSASAEASSSAHAALSAASQDASSSASSEFAAECVDEHGNITLYALTELTGVQLETLLTQQGYVWNEKNNWVRETDGADFASVDEENVVSRDAYAQMTEKGDAIRILAMNMVAGYESPEAALRGNAKCSVEDSFFDGDAGIAIFHGPSMKEYFAIITPSGENLATILVFSEESLSSGLADKYLGTEVGHSLQEAWKNATGKEGYGH